MLYLLGYIFACFMFVTGLGYGLSRLHAQSTLKPQMRLPRRPPAIRSRVLISFSIILPFMALSFLLLTFAAMRIAQNQGQQGHLAYIFTSLFIPTLCFLIGYFYFRKAVRS